MLKNFYNNCTNFKSVAHGESFHNKPLTANCSHCVYFSSRNCNLNNIKYSEKTFYSF